MIVRLMNQGQYTVDDSLLAPLNELDDKASAAVEASDGAKLTEALDEMWKLVEREGRQLSIDDLSASDVLIPPSDLSLEETRQLFSEEGLIPDLPVPEGVES